MKLLLLCLCLLIQDGLTRTVFSHKSDSNSDSDSDSTTNNMINTNNVTKSSENFESENSNDQFCVKKNGERRYGL